MSSRRASAGVGGGGGAAEGGGRLDLGRSRDSGAFDLLSADDLNLFGDEDDDGGENGNWSWSRQGVATIAVALLGLYLVVSMFPGLLRIQQITQEHRTSHYHQRRGNATYPFPAGEGAGAGGGGLSKDQIEKIIQQQVNSHMNRYEAHVQQDTKALTGKFGALEAMIESLQKQQEALPTKDDLSSKVMEQLKVEIEEKLANQSAAILTAQNAATPVSPPEQAQQIISQSQQQVKILDEKKSELEGLVKTLSDRLTEMKEYQTNGGGDLAHMKEEAKALDEWTQKSMKEINDVISSLREAQQPHGQLDELADKVKEARELKTAIEEGLASLKKENLQANQLLELARAETRAIDENQHAFNATLEKVQKQIEEISKMSSKADVHGLVDQVTKGKEEMNQQEANLALRLNEVNSILDALKEMEKGGVSEKVKEEVQRIEAHFQTQVDGIREQAKDMERTLKKVLEQRARLQEQVDEAAAAIVVAGEDGGGGGIVVSKEELKKVCLEAVHEEGLQIPAAPARTPVATAISNLSCMAVIADEVEKAVRLYEADETGLPDYAQATAGGETIRSLSSPTHTPPGQWISTDWYHLLGLGHQISPIGVTITANRKKVGDCWPFSGNQGQLTVKLREPLVPSNFTLEHIVKKISPNPLTAVRRFRVLGLTDLKAKPVQLHTQPFLKYDLYGPRPVQMFALDAVNGEAFWYVMMDVLTNWGNAEYTCVYRVRVHGQPTESSSPAR